MRRRRVMERFSIDVPPVDIDRMPVDDARVLVVGAPADDPATAPLGEEFAVDREDDPMIALGMLAGNQYDAVVVRAKPGTMDEMTQFCADVRRNVTFFNLPVLLTLPEDAVEVANAAHDERVSDVLFDPVDPLDLRQQVLVWIRHWRYRGRLIAAARQTKSIVTIDAVTQLSSHAFLMDYMSDLVEDCEAHERGFALGYIDIRDVAQINRDFGYSAGDHLLRQIGQIVRRLVRVEDMGARYRGKEFCVLLPHTDGEVAHLVVERLASVVRNTEFLLMGCPQAMKPDLGTGWAVYEPGDTPQSLLDRAHGAVK